MKANNIRKHVTKYIALAGLCFTFALPQTADAAGYMKIGDIQGESQRSTSDGGDGWIDVQSMSMGIHRPGSGATGQSRRRGTAIVEDLSFSKELDKSSPKLQEACLTGEVIPQAVVELTRTYGDQEVVYLRIEFKKVLITSTSLNYDETRATADASSDPVPTEDFSFNYEEIRFIYIQLDEEGVSQGTVEYGWKVEEGEA